MRLVLSGSAPLSPEVVEEFTGAHRHPGPPGLRPDRGGAGRHQHPVQPATRRPARSAPRCPASSSGWSTSAAHAPEGEDPGEIQVRGANLFSGYWPDGADGPDADGWWATGDVGFLDATGDLFLVDRLKELVIVSGFNVYPIEVEDVIREVDGVAEAAVIGVADDADRRGGGRLRRAAPGRRPADDRRGRRTRGTAQTRLARFKQPTRIEVVDELPLHRHRQGPEGPAARHRAPPGAGAAGVSAVTPRVTLYSRPGCHLCDDAREVDRRGLRRAGRDVRRGRHRRRPGAAATGSARRSR